MEDPALTLRYRQPDRRWVKALPTGNGRLGAMVFGSPGHERLALNEDTFWSGAPYDPSHPEAREHLAEVRRLGFEGRNAAAQALADRHLMGRPRHLQAYQPLADLRLRFGDAAGEPVTDYRGGLDLERGLAFVRYVRGGVRHERTVFASAPDQAVVVHLTCDRPGGLSLDVACDSVHPTVMRPLGGDGLALSGHWDPRPPAPGSLRSEAAGEGLRLVVHLRAVPVGGEVAATSAGIPIRGADRVTYILTAATSFRGQDPKARAAADLAAATARSHDAFLCAHSADHAGLFSRVRLVPP